MAVGDVIADVVSIASSGNSTFQPAAGVEILITQFGFTTMSGNNLAAISLYDGTNIGNVFIAAGTTPATPVLLKLGITNSHYIYIDNGSTGTEIMSYSGIQIK